MSYPLAKAMTASREGWWANREGHEDVTAGQAVKHFVRDNAVCVTRQPQITGFNHPMTRLRLSGIRNGNVAFVHAPWSSTR